MLFNFYVLLTLAIIHSTSAALEIPATENGCSKLNRDEIEKHLSTKTPYRAVANLDDAPLVYPGCRATRMWAVIRHGTRNPSKEVIESAQEDLERLKIKILSSKNSSLCAEEKARLQNWSFNLTAEEEKYLVPEGEDELIELAERMQNRFEQLLPDTYDPKLYYFKYTATQRTLKSAKSFTTGLFGRHRIGAVSYPEALQRDPVLRRTAEDPIAILEAVADFYRLLGTIFAYV